MKGSERWLKKPFNILLTLSTYYAALTGGITTVLKNALCQQVALFLTKQMAFTRQFSEEALTQKVTNFFSNGA